MPSEGVDPWSATNKDVREALREPAAEATVVTVAAVEGSAYRRPGAKMLVTPAGVTTGAVTAGCLEEPVVDICDGVRRTGRSRTERFDLTGTDETWGLGLGCNGVIDLLVEPRDGSWNPVLSALREGDPVTVVTVVESAAETAVGDRVAVGGEQTLAVPDRDPIPSNYLRGAEDAIERVTGTGRTSTVSVDDATLLIDGLTPVPELLLFGSQNDLGPLVTLGSRAGFRVSIHSPRGGVDESTFPRADDVRTGHPSTVAPGAPEQHTYAVVMSHNLVDDRLAVETLLRETDVPYVGVMGPRDRFDSLRDQLVRDGVALTADERNRVAAPVGLDLGGSTPTDIALSVISEVVAVRNDREGGRLREETGPIHPTEPGR
jgi:xanthine dehydrogenase accessory factor